MASSWSQHNVDGLPNPEPPQDEDVPGGTADSADAKAELAAEAGAEATAEGSFGSVSDGAADGSSDALPPAPSRRKVAPSAFALVLVAILAGGALFMGGFTLGAHVATTPGTPADQETRFGPFWDVYQLIQNEYAGSPRPSADQLVQAAIKGMIESLNDPWSYYQSPNDYSNSILSVGGQAVGIGVQVQLQTVAAAGSAASCTTIGNGCELAINAPIPGSPAEAAGIAPGDVIATVDGNTLDGKTLDQATALIKGTRGTTVSLGIVRNGVAMTIKIVRDVFDLPQVTARSLANGSVAYIAISGVNDPAFSQFHDALAKALAAGQTNVILDLRGNLGGYVADAVHIASQFLGSGTVLYQQEATGDPQALPAEAGGLATGTSIHLVVLVDGNTASAAEIVAGALQARGRAELIGAKTYGKGVVQEWLPLSNNFGGIHLTIARWLTPDKVWIQGKGLTPDIAIDSSGARAGTDPVLDAALAKLGFPASAAASPNPSAAPSRSPLPGTTGAPTPAPSLSPSPAAS